MDKLRYFFKHIVFDFLRISGVYRRLRRLHHDKAIVLTYHGVLPHIPADRSDFEYRNFVSAEQFEKHIQLLLKYYRPLSIDDFYAPNRDISGGFLITFDDGFQNNYRYAMPILKRYGVKACFFITTGLIGTQEYLWTEQVTHLIQNTVQLQLTLTLDRERTFDLLSSPQRELASQQIRKYMKTRRRQDRDAILQQLRHKLADVSFLVGPEEADRFLLMTWEEVREMIKAGQCIGSHTHTHPILSSLSKSESLEELTRSKRLIEAHTGHPCYAMSYPNGEQDDFSEVQKKQLSELGYRIAFTQLPLFNTAHTHHFEMRRINIPLKMPLPMIEAKLCGFLD